MAIWRTSRKFSRRYRVTDRMAAVMRLFGLDRQRLRAWQGPFALTLDVRPGQVVYLTGPSGSGKSVLLRGLYEAAPAEERLWLGDVRVEADRAVIDCFEGSVLETLQALSRAGLGDAFCAVQRPGELSEGQQYRYRLARAFAGGRRWIFADEFGSTLDRLTAAVVAWQVRRLADRSGRTFVLASSHDDVLADLQPDILVVCRLDGTREVIDRRNRGGRMDRADGQDAPVGRNGRRACLSGRAAGVDRRWPTARPDGGLHGCVRRPRGFFVSDRQVEVGDDGDGMYGDGAASDRAGGPAGI